MDSLIIKGKKETYFTPAVNFDVQSGLCIVSGESYLENTNEFYSPLEKWLREYLEAKDNLVFNIKLTYFNTSSSRSILELLTVLKVYKDLGKSIEVNWFYEEWDEDMLQDAEDFAEDSGLDINIMTFTEEAEEA